MYSNGCTDETLLLNVTINALPEPASGDDDEDTAAIMEEPDFVNRCHWMPLYKSTSPCGRWGLSLTPRNDDRDKVYLFGGQRGSLCLDDLWLV
jgi:hypothetical protein